MATCHCSPRRSHRGRPVSSRVCLRSGCGKLIEPGTRTGRCERHRPRQASSTAKGYGKEHRRLRARWKRRVEAGGVVCARCGWLIAPGELWDLGHSDDDRSRYVGPEQRSCNRSKGQTGPRSTWWRGSRQSEDEPGGEAGCRHPLVSVSTRVLFDP